MNVLAACKWPDNSKLIADVARLGYIRSFDKVLDPTYGMGIWWNTFRPDNLVTHYAPDDGVDFRALPYEDNSFDVVVFDPPYVSTGGRKTSTLRKRVDGGPETEFQHRYGLFNAPKTPELLQTLINDGLTECSRVTNKVLLVKCKDYVSSGHLYLGTHHTLVHALSLGLRCEERFEHIGNEPVQPSGRRQVHARRNLSTLFVFIKKEKI